MRGDKLSAISCQLSAGPDRTAAIRNRGTANGSSRSVAAAVVGTAALLFSFASNAEEASKPAKKKIMLGAVSASGVPAGEAQSLGTLICAELAANKGYDVVCPDDVGAVLKEQALKMGLGACTAGDCMDATAKMMESDLNVTADLESKDGKLALSLAIVDAKTGARAAAAKTDPAPGLEKLTAKIKGAVVDLYKALAAPPPAEKKPDPAPAPKGDATKP